MRSDGGGDFVTGAGGFLGGVVRGWFRAAGWEVCGMWHEVPPDTAIVHRGVRGDLVAMDAAVALGMEFTPLDEGLARIDPFGEDARYHSA